MNDIEITERGYKRAEDIKPGDVVLLREPTEPTGWAYHEVRAIQKEGTRRIVVRSVMGPTWTLPRALEVEFIVERPA